MTRLPGADRGGHRKTSTLIMAAVTAAVMVWFGGDALARGKPNAWSKVAQPSSAPARAIGSYANGCIDGAVAMPLTGPGYEVTKPKRNRFYGHPSLIRFLQRLGRQVKQHQLGVIMIADLSQPRGGPMSYGHASHQTGLDVDIWYWSPKVATKRRLTVKERNRFSAKSVLRESRRRHQPKLWGARERRIIELAAQGQEVERILVHPALKKDLCAWKPGAPWLRKVRPWWGHDDHLHLRLRCPKDSPACKAQGAIPKGLGCDNLDWWFSPKAGSTYRRQHKARKPPVLPDACQAIIQK